MRPPIGRPVTEYKLFPRLSPTLAYRHDAYFRRCISQVRPILLVPDLSQNFH
jgi:hypothetical protein